MCSHWSHVELYFDCSLYPRVTLPFILWKAWDFAKLTNEGGLCYAPHKTLTLTCSKVCNKSKITLQDITLTRSIALVTWFKVSGLFAGGRHGLCTVQLLFGLYYWTVQLQCWNDRPCDGAHVRVVSCWWMWKMISSTSSQLIRADDAGACWHLHYL